MTPPGNRPAPDDRIRRCAIVLIEPVERLELDVAGLFRGGDAVKTVSRWMALAAHLEDDIAVDDAALAALRSIGPDHWLARSSLSPAIEPAVIERLLDSGLLVGDDDRHRQHRQRDDAVRAGHWRALPALDHARSRWSDARHGAGTRLAREQGMADILQTHGMPPPHVKECAPAADRIVLPEKQPSALDDLFARRVTCRNFDRDALLALPAFASMMQRVFGAHAVVEVMPGAFGLKKANPSGGALHPLEAYVLVRRVDGVAPGLYHYHPVDNALEPVAVLDPVAAGETANLFVAGQDYFADAPVHVVLAARFGRTQWKYRNHAKAYRAITIEVGHVAQNLYLAATEAGLGAYVTAAINEIDIERILALDGMVEGPLAVLGFGSRASDRATVEFDPLHAVWPADPPSRGEPR